MPTRPSSIRPPKLRCVLLVSICVNVCQCVYMARSLIPYTKFGTNSTPSFHTPSLHFVFVPGDNIDPGRVPGTGGQASHECHASHQCGGGNGHVGGATDNGGPSQSDPIPVQRRGEGGGDVNSTRRREPRWCGRGRFARAIVGPGGGEGRRGGGYGSCIGR